MINRFVQKLCRYAVLTADEVSALERVTADPLRFDARQDLIREGDRPGPVIVMLEGWAFRYKVLPSGARQIMAFLMPGDVCDLHVCLTATMDHSIQTATPVQAAIISGPVMDDLLRSSPAITQAMYVAQLLEEGTLRAWIVSLGRRSSVERVAHLLMELHVRSAHGGDTARNATELPLSQVMLADALGMTPVHLNRVLREFRESGAVESQRGVLRISDTRALVRHSGYDDNYLHRRMAGTPLHH